MEDIFHSFIHSFSVLLNIITLYWLLFESKIEYTLVKYKKQKERKRMAYGIFGEKNERNK